MSGYSYMTPTQTTPTQPRSRLYTGTLPPRRNCPLDIDALLVPRELCAPLPDDKTDCCSEDGRQPLTNFLTTRFQYYDTQRLIYMPVYDRLASTSQEPSYSMPEPLSESPAMRELRKVQNSFSAEIDNIQIAQSELYDCTLPSYMFDSDFDPSSLFEYTSVQPIVRPFSWENTGVEPKAPVFETINPALLGGRPLSPPPALDSDDEDEFSLSSELAKLDARLPRLDDKEPTSALQVAPKIPEASLLLSPSLKRRPLPDSDDTTDSAPSSSRKRARSLSPSDAEEDSGDESDFKPTVVVPATKKAKGGRRRRVKKVTKRKKNAMPPSVCDQCNSSFTRLADLKRHVDSVHESRSKEEILAETRPDHRRWCMGCQKILARPDARSRHEDTCSVFLTTFGPR